MPSLIDEDTPQEARTRTGFDGEEYRLVFSDEVSLERASGGERTGELIEEERAVQSGGKDVLAGRRHVLGGSGSELLVSTVSRL